MQIHSGLLHSLATVLTHRNAYPHVKHELVLRDILHRDGTQAASAAPRCLSRADAEKQAPALIDFHVDALTAYIDKRGGITTAPNVHHAIAAVQSEGLLAYWVEQIETAVQP